MSNTELGQDFEPGNGRILYVTLHRERGAPAPYQQIQHVLRVEILREMSPGDRMPAERELAKRFNANRATVSRAISSLVNEGLLVRRVRCGTFVAGSGCQARIKTRTVGLVVPYIQGPFPAAMIRGAVRGFRECGYKAVLFDSEDSMLAEASELERLVQEGLDGALVMPVIDADNARLFGRLISLGFPIVFLDRKSVEIEADCVSSDNFRGAYEATSRLIARGHRRIAHFTRLIYRPCTSIQDRRLGYEQALIDHGIQVDPELVCPPTPYKEDSLTYKATLAYLRHGDQPVTAVFALSDQFAFATIASCAALGLNIPEDIEIASFFDGGFRPMNQKIPLLTVVQRQDEIGRRAAELLVSRIEGSGPKGPQTITVRPDVTYSQYSGETKN